MKESTIFSPHTLRNALFRKGCPITKATLAKHENGEQYLTFDGLARNKVMDKFLNTTNYDAVFNIWMDSEWRSVVTTNQFTIDACLNINCKFEV